MLTLTYALVTLSVEQKKLQSCVQDLLQHIQIERQQKTVTDQARFEDLLARFMQLDQVCRSRNIELYLLPVIRSATSEADALLSELDTLAAMGRIALRTVRGRLRQTMVRGSFEIDYLCNSLEQYCHNLTKRLSLEELQILPLAQRVISSDEWFDIAARFISHDSTRRIKNTVDHEQIEMLATEQESAVHFSAHHGHETVT